MAATSRTPAEPRRTGAPPWGLCLLPSGHLPEVPVAGNVAVSYPGGRLPGERDGAEHRSLRGAAHSRRYRRGDAVSPAMERIRPARLDSERRVAAGVLGYLLRGRNQRMLHPLSGRRSKLRNQSQHPDGRLLPVMSLAPANRYYCGWDASMVISAW